MLGIITEITKYDVKIRIREEISEVATVKCRSSKNGEFCTRISEGARYRERGRRQVELLERTRDTDLMNSWYTTRRFYAYYSLRNA